MASVKQLKAEAVESVKQFVEETVRLRPVVDTIGVGQIAAALRRGGYAAFLELAIYQLVKDGMFEPIVRSEVKLTSEVVYLTNAYRQGILANMEDKQGGSDNV